MIQYITKLSDKEVKKNIAKYIISNIKKDDLLIENYAIHVNKILHLDSTHRYRVNLYISSKYVECAINQLKFTSVMRCFITFNPSKQDLYDILFNTNKQLYLILKSANSKLLQYVLSYEKEKKKR